jgi:DNA-binding MarR family transcriptional regulator
VTSALSTDELVELAVRLRLAVARTNRRLRLYDAGEISPTLHACLVTIEHRGPITHGELATIERLTPPSITNIVSQLEGRGFVQRTRDPSDGRVSLLQVTDEGRDFLQRDRARRTAWLMERMERLSPSDRRRLAASVDVLEKLAAMPEDGQ